MMGYKVPVYETAEESWEPYALEVLASVLDGGQSARLPQRLVRGSEVATSAGAAYSLYQRLDGLFLFDGIPGNGRSVEELESAIRAEIERLQEDLVEARELERIKAQVIANKVFDRDSMMNMAIQTGMLESIGLDWTLMTEYLRAIESVTPEQVRTVARKYLVDERLTIGVLLPEDGKLAAGPAQ
jgi:zinc protease